MRRKTETGKSQKGKHGYGGGCRPQTNGRNPRGRG